MMTGLVSMGILTNHTRDVRLLSSCSFTTRGKHAFKHLVVRGVSAHERYVPVDGLWCEKIVLPAIGFSIVEIHFSRLKIFKPCTPSLGLNEVRGRIEKVPIGERSLRESC